MLQKSKILVIDFTNFYGGGQKFIYNLHFILGKDLDISFALANEKLINQLEGQNLLILRNNFIYSLNEIIKINKFITLNKFDYIILNGNRSIYFSFLINSISKKIAYKHTSNNAYNNLFKRIFVSIILNFNYLFCHRIILLFNKAKAEIFYSNNKIRILPNPIFLNNNNSNLKKILKKEILSLVVITRIDPDKGLEWLIDCFANLVKLIDTPVELKIAGTGPFEEVLKQKILDLELGNVYLMGFVNDVTILLENADIFLLTSKFESFPLSILEALSFGLPIISTDTGGINEIVLNNINGYLVNYKNDFQLMNAMIKLVGDPNLRLQFGSESYKLYLDKFTAEVYKNNFVKCLSN